MQLPSPGMQDTKKAGNIATDKPFIRGQGLQRLGRGFKHGRICDTLIAPDEGSDLFRDSEGNHKVMSSHLSFELFFLPPSGLMVLASWAMTVATRAKQHMRPATFLAFIDCDAILLCAAIDNSVDGFSMFSRHGLTKPLNILRTVRSKDVFDGFHVTVLS